MARRATPGPRALVLGGTGFIGSAVAAELRRRCVPTVVHGSKTLDLASPGAGSRLRRLVDERTIVFLFSRAPYVSAPWAGYACDAAILATAAAAMRECPARKWVYLGSTAIFGTARSNRSIREDAPLSPGSPYAASKVLGELLLGSSSEAAGAPLLVLRPPMVYGPGDPSTAYGPGRLIRSLIERGELRLFGNGGDLRDFLFVDDLARIAVDLALGARTGTFNVSSGKAATFAEVASHLRRLSGKGRVIREPRRVPKTDQRLEPSKLRRALPRARFTPLIQGLEAAYRAALSGR